MNQVIIRYRNMPCQIKGFVSEDPDGDYNIYINSKLPYIVQTEVLIHELEHITREDLNNDFSLSQIEGF